MGGKHLKTTIRAQGVKFTKERREQAMETFLDAYKSSGNIRASCMASGIDRQTVHYWCEHYEEFAFKYNEADAEVDDLIDAELLRRAVHGEREAVITNSGKIAYDENNNPIYNTKRSDQLLMFIAKARMPHKYRERQQLDATVNMTGQVHTTTDAIAVDTRQLTVLQLARLKELAVEIRQREQGQDGND